MKNNKLYIHFASKMKLCFFFKASVMIIILWKGDPINELRISWIGVGIFFQAGAVNEVNDESYSIITIHKLFLSCTTFLLYYFIFFLFVSNDILLQYRENKKKNKLKFLHSIYILFDMNKNIAQVVPIVVLEIRFRKKSYV